MSDGIAGGGRSPPARALKCASPAVPLRALWLARADAPPLVGLPFPAAIEKMCIAFTPLPAPLLTVGSVTEATVLPGSSGTDAKYTLTGCCVCVLLAKFQLDVLVAIWSPLTAALLNQSAMEMLYGWVLPSV